MPSIRLFPTDEQDPVATLAARLARYNDERSFLDFNIQRLEDVDSRFIEKRAVDPGFTGWLDGPLPAASTWVRQFGYWMQYGQGGLAINFKDGATCWYFHTGTDLYAGMRAAASKGRFIHEYIFKRIPYQLVGG